MSESKPLPVAVAAPIVETGPVGTAPGVTVITDEFGTRVVVDPSKVAAPSIPEGVVAYAAPVVAPAQLQGNVIGVPGGAFAAPLAAPVGASSTGGPAATKVVRDGITYYIVDKK
ncbi:hypothetical protein [Andreprevotia chitinilytica]|uniref:hypothetical protein n=1 Tax=Andreprevotia chitinilytica TaxID=396808 RepID=UPI0012EC12B3|nr:hypothetical protein [Andreprevotia chitinilytica]